MSAPARTRPPAVAPPSEPRRAPAFGRLVVGGLLVLLGLVWLVEATGLADVRWRTVLSAAVLGIGLLLLASVRSHRAGGLVGIGVVLSLVLVVTSVASGAPFLAGAGERTHRPATVAEIQDGYELGAGPLTLDLTDLTVTPGDTPVEASVGAGELLVRLPPGVAAEVEASSGIGEVDVLGRTSSGLGSDVTRSLPGDEDAGRLLLRLSVGLGRIEVR